MFGGLDIKTTKNEPDDQSAAPAAAPASSFGFLNAGPTGSTTEASAAPTSSSFSFMNPTPAPIEDASSSTPVPVPTSGFSFMMPATSDSAAVDAEIETVEAPAPVSAPSSGFDFLIPSPSNDQAELGETVPAEDKSNNEAPSMTQAPSAFSFLSSPATSMDASDSPALPTTEVPVMVSRDFTSGSAASSVVSAPSPTPPNILDTAAPPATTNGLPTGTGITFGTSAKRNVVKKKKTRATRIGAGAAGTPPIPPAAATPVPAVAPAAAPAENKSSRDDAIEAAKRAEQFMQSKASEEAKALPKSRKPTESNGPPDIATANSTDSVLAAAQKAAEEAKILQQQHQKGGGFMGTFFKGFRGSPNTTGGISGSSSSLPQVGQESTVNQPSSRRSIPEPTSKAQVPSQPTLSDDNDDDDDVVVVSSKVESHVPEVEEETPAPTSSFIPVVLPPANASKVDPKIAVASPSKPIEIKNFIVPKVQSHSILPTPKKSKTPTQIFEEYQALFAQSVHRAMEQVENVRSQQKMLFEERFVSLAKDRLATQQIEQTEQQLQTAVEEEDYELADQLGQVLDGHKREKHEVGLMLENISKALGQLDSQKELVVHSVATCFDNLAVRLEELKDKEAASEQKDDDETLKQFASISKQLSAEQERLQQDLKHLERDEKLVSEERKELEDAIKEQTGEIERQKEDAENKLEVVQKEIDELRKQLEKKQKDAADLRTEMFGYEDSISKVRVKFSRQLNRVDKKERALKESRSEWELEDSTHKKQKEAHELQVQSHSEALLAHDALMKTLNSELRLAKDFYELIPTQVGFTHDKKADDDGEGGEEDDLAQLQANVVKCEAAVSEAKILLKAANSVIVNLQTERDTLITRIPQLESLKKDAAAKRDFKSASKASKEIKDATARLKECEEELNGEAEAKKKAAEEELERLNNELVQTRELANEKEKVSGLEKMAWLANRISQLIERKREACGEATSIENTVKGVGAFVLESQIRALKAEGRDLGNKYGGWEDLMKDMQMDDDDEQSALSHTSDNHCTDQTVPATLEEKPIEPDDGLTIEERVEKVKSLVATLKKAEEDLETAAAAEDFELAAELQDVIEALASEIAEIDLPEEVLADAVSGDSEIESDTDPGPGTPKEEEEKKDTTEGDADHVPDEVSPEIGNDSTEEAHGYAMDDRANLEAEPEQLNRSTPDNADETELPNGVNDEDEGEQPIGDENSEEKFSSPEELPFEDDSGIQSVSTDDAA